MLSVISADKKGYIVGLLILAAAAVLAGCTALAETSKPEAAATKREVAAAEQKPDDDLRMTRNAYAEMPQDGDFEYSSPAPSMPKSTINLTKTTFGKIKTGMTLAEVEKLLGDRGMLVSTMD